MGVRGGGGEDEERMGLQVQKRKDEEKGREEEG